MPTTMIDMQREIDALRQDRDRLAVSVRVLERQRDQFRESFLRNERAMRDAATEVIAVRTSTSWAVTRPLRLLSKTWSALLKGPSYWRHVYAVRDEVRANWRRENPIAAAAVATGGLVGASLEPARLETNDVVAEPTVESEAPQIAHAEGNARVRDALMRVGNIAPF